MGDNEPWIDFDGDGTGDDYETEAFADGGGQYTHYDEDGNADAVAYDFDGDGLIDAMDVDSDGDGSLDTTMFDETGDGYMDSEIHWEDTGSEPSADEPGAQPQDNSSGTTDSVADLLQNPFGN